MLPDLEWMEFLRRFRHAEELGFDIATTADQFVDWKNPSVPWFDVWTALGKGDHGETAAGIVLNHFSGSTS